MGYRHGIGFGVLRRVLLIAIGGFALAAAGPIRGQVESPPDPHADAPFFAANPAPDGDDDSARSDPPPPAAVKSDAEKPYQLRDQIEQLELLLAGESAPDTEISTLFRIDVTDARAVAARIDALRLSLDTLTEERDQLRSTATPIGDDDDSAGGDDDSARTGVAPPPLSEKDAARLKLLDLLIQRDNLRLAFLVLPDEERAGILDGIAERRALATERVAATESRKDAAEAARRAEQARREAEAEAAAALTRALKELAEERARAEQARYGFAYLRSTGADDRFARAEIHAESQDWARRAEARIAAEELPEYEAITLYEEAVDLLDPARDDLSAALTDLGAASHYDVYEPEIDPHATRYLEHPIERAALLRVMEAVETERDEAVAEERGWRWDRLDSTSALVFRLNDARLDLLPRLGNEDRAELLSASRTGLEQLSREIGHLGLMTRWYVRCRYRDVRAVPGWMVDTLGRGATRWSAILLLIVAIASIWAFRNRKNLLTRFNKWVRAEAREREREQLGLRIVRWVNTLGVDLGIWISVWLAVALSNRLTDVAEVQLLERLALTYAAYRFLRGSVHALILSAVSFTRRKVSTEISDRILRSVRLMGRYALGVAAFLVVAATVVGKGYLYNLVLELSWLGAIPIAFVLLRRWRDDLFDIYVPTFPRSRLNTLIEKYRKRSTAVFVVIPAALHLAGRAVWIYARAWALRFERIRKAVSYIFRRRLETKAAAVGHGTTDLSTLPDDLRESFRADPTDDLAVAHYPGMDQALGLVERYLDGGPGGAIALVGERGVGKSTWLHELQGRIEHLPVRYARIENSVIGEAAACAELCRILELERCTDIDTLTRGIHELPRQVVMLDHCQEFVLRCVRGAEGFEAAAQVLQRTVGQLVWVCSFSKPIWEYLEFAHKGQNVFDQVQFLRGWTEEQILDLVARRTAMASYTVTFEDLIDDDVHEQERDAEITRTQERFIRLLWDYTDGIPRLAMYFWLRSLIPDGERWSDKSAARVRLFKGPVPDDLEHLQEQSRFVLNSVVSHGMLSLDEAVQVLQYTPDQCLSILELLRARGYLALDGDRYRVTNHWDRAVVRYLRRKHLLYQ